MTDVANKKHEVAKEIRALLMSSPAALTIEEVRRDFHNFMDKPIPFRELGYSTLEDMLRDMTGVLHITYKRGMMCLQVIPDDSTRHIANMVSKQKIPNKNKYATMRRGPPPRMQRIQTASLPHYIRKNISELFRSYSNGLPLTHFDTAYSKRFGSMFSFNRLGFVSMKELLYSVPDIVALKEFQGGEWRVLPAHCPAPEGNWRTTKKSGEESENKPPDDWGGVHADYNHSSSVPAQLYNNLLPYRVDDTNSGGKGRGRGMKRSASGGDKTSFGACRESESSLDSFESNGYQDIESDINDVLSTELRQLLSENVNGIWASQLPFVYQLKFGSQLNFKDKGFMSVIELMNSLPDIVRIERPSAKGDWILFDARIPPKSSQAISPKSGKANSPKSDQAKSPRSNQTISSKSNKASSPKSVLMMPTLDKDFTYRTSQFKFNPEPEEEVVKSTLPEDAILPGACYRHLELPPIGDYFEAYVSNIVSPGLFWFQIRSKQTTVVLEKLMNQLETFYSSAESLRYKIPDELLVVGLVVAAIFPEDSNWHRCVVIKIEIGHMVQRPDSVGVFPWVYDTDEGMKCKLCLEFGDDKKIDLVVGSVYFVDYGNTCGVHKNNIRLLRSKFLKLPIQAVQGRLANIQPNGQSEQKWSLNARNKLLSMCINTPLVALATAEKDRVMSLVLIDTSQEEDVCYNDVLVHEGYALFKPDDHTTNLTGPTDALEIPDYSYIYGVTQSSYTDSVTQSSQETAVSEIKQRFVKQEQLTSDYKIHLINIDGIARVLSEEISAFLFDTDVLTGMLQQKRKNFSKIEISIEELPQVFHELQGYEAIPTTRKCISLYELNSLPMILSVFNFTSGELVTSIKDVIERFGPEDLYWKTMESETVSSVKMTNVVTPMKNTETQPMTKSAASTQSNPSSQNLINTVPPETVSPVKMTNVVTPMKKTEPPSLTKPVISSQSNPTNQNLLNTLNMTPQQMLYQQMLIAQMNQQVMLNPLMSQLMLGQVGNLSMMQGVRSEGQQLPGLNNIPSVQSGNTPPGIGNMMPTLGLPNMGNIPPLGGAMLNPTSTGQANDISNPADLSEIPLLPGLLPLLQTLSIGRGSGNRK